MEQIQQKNCKIVWSANAQKTFDSIIRYLDEEWTEKEANNFIARVNAKLIILQTQPEIGVPSSKKIFRTVLHKNVNLYYQYYPRKKEIRLLSFWDTRQDPDSLKY